ncbi:MAG: GDSL-type esterase/lipase family protein [Polyangiales bacterium]
MLSRVVRSPLAVLALGAAATTAWTAAWEVLARPSTAAAEPPVAANDEPTRNASNALPAPTPEAPAYRLGPRLLGEPSEEVPGLPIAIEDRDGRSLASFHAALRRAERGAGQARLVFFGASHVASDLFTGHIREAMQQRFGDAGHGLILPAHPWRTYRHRGVELESSRRDWQSEKVRVGTDAPEPFGVHGVYVQSSRANAYGRLRTTASGIGSTASLFDVYYQTRPDGGSFEVSIDGREVQTVSTQSDTLGAGYATFHVPDAQHELELQVRGDGTVRFFGVAVERDAPGVIVDTLGINGARARYHLLWEDATYREQLQRRRPDLVVLAYGTNESGDDAPIERYEAELRSVVARVRETVPDASCLLVGPSDRPVRRGDGTFEDRPRTGQIIEVQHRVAIESGCGFFDLVAFTGGPLSMVQWVAHEPPYAAPDHVHYTRRGYERLGEVLLGALLDGYDPDSPRE